MVSVDLKGLPSNLSKRGYALLDSGLECTLEKVNFPWGSRRDMLKDLILVGKQERSRRQKKLDWFNSRLEEAYGNCEVGLRIDLGGNSNINLLQKRLDPLNFEKGGLFGDLDARDLSISRGQASSAIGGYIKNGCECLLDYLRAGMLEEYGRSRPDFDILLIYAKKFEERGILEAGYSNRFEKDYGVAGIVCEEVKGEVNPFVLEGYANELNNLGRQEQNPESPWTLLVLDEEYLDVLGRIDGLLKESPEYAEPMLAVAESVLREKIKSRKNNISGKLGSGGDLMEPDEPLSSLNKCCQYTMQVFGKDCFSEELENKRETMLARF